MDKDFYKKYFSGDDPFEELPDDEEDDSSASSDNDYDEYDDDEENDEDYDDYDGRHSPLSRGFLAAMAVCVVAVGAAVWTTISSVNTYLSTEAGTSDTESTASVSSQVSSVESTAQVAAVVSGETADTDTDTDTDGSTDTDTSAPTFTVKPVNSEIIEDYSETPVYNATLGDYRAHTGIDYAAEVGDKVRCMAKGVVTDIYYDDMMGYVVAVRHSGGVVSYYCGLSKTALVQVGDEVSAGDYVGTVHTIPCETAGSSHVHVAVQCDGEWVSPEVYMQGEDG